MSRPLSMIVMRRRAAVRELHSLAIPGGVARKLLRVSLGAWQGDVRALGLKFEYGTTKASALRGAAKERALEMAALYEAGCTLEQIGAQHRISRERVRQLMTKHCGTTAKDGGQHHKAVRKAAIREQLRDRKSWAKHGCSWADYVSIRALKKPTRAFASQRGCAVTRGIVWDLTLWQWWTVWQQSGKWDQRGRRADAFVMCRKNDVGPYSPGNVYIATLRHNATVQPNNPYRKDHPDHDRVMQQIARTTRVCSLDGCSKRHFAQGYCNNHYYHFVTKVRASGERVAA